MSHALLGRKLQMMQVFSDEGPVVPVTVVQAGPCPIVQVKTVEQDGYAAVQIAYEPSKKNISKPVRGHFKKSKLKPHRHLREIRFAESVPAEAAVGAEMTVAIFSAGDVVDVIGTTKGKGFQGTIKRHNFSRGRETHGNMNVRRPGSIGQCSTPSRVFKGMKMAGQTGNARKTVKNLEVIRVDLENNLLFIKGAIPGPNGGLVFVRDAKTGATKDQRQRPLVVAPEEVAAEEAAG